MSEHDALQGVRRNIALYGQKEAARHFKASQRFREGGRPDMAEAHSNWAAVASLDARSALFSLLAGRPLTDEEWADL